MSLCRSDGRKSPKGKSFSSSSFLFLHNFSSFPNENLFYISLLYEMQNIPYGQPVLTQHQQAKSSLHPFQLWPSRLRRPQRRGNGTRPHRQHRLHQLRFRAVPGCVGDERGIPAEAARVLGRHEEAQQGLSGSLMRSERQMWGGKGGLL